MNPSADCCPSDPAELAEMYCLDKLSPEAVEIFEDHYITCPTCAEAVEKAQKYVDAMRRAAQHLRRNNPPQ